MRLLQRIFINHNRLFLDPFLERSRMNYLYKYRQVLMIIQELELFPWIIAILSGGVGAIITMNTSGPFYGFALFSWVTILMFIALIIFFYYFILL
jgi:hypothetical protein